MSIALVEEVAHGLKGRARKLVLPEGENERILAAARTLVDRDLASVLLPGDQTVIESAATTAGISLDGMSIVDPGTSEHLEAFIESYIELRPGSKPGVARRMLARPVFFAGSMLRAGLADAMLAGATATTARVIEAGLLTVGLADGIDTPSSSFLMLLPDGGAFVFADCAFNVEPTVEELADIAISSAATAAALLTEEPRVAFLSFSTKGSGKHELARNMANAAELTASRAPDLLIDGELQADTAIAERVASIKLDDVGPVAGRANVLIFPNLDAGNIAYKLVEQLAGASALGPFLQGFAAPVTDLSRGATVGDIVDAAILTLGRAG